MRIPAPYAMLWVYSALRLGVLLLLGAPSLSAQNSSIYNGPRDYPVGSYPESVVVGDFNVDGRPDIATANQAANNVSILLQKSDGTFQAAVNYTVGNGPMWLEVGDVNNDAKLDLLLVNVTDNTLAVLLGNGDGTFQPQKLMAISGSPPACQSVPGCLAIGDFDEDGKLDVAIGVPLPQVGAYAAAVFLGKGDGTFQAPVNYSLNGQPFALVAADFNNDGKLDLVTVGNGVSLLLGKGDGTFQAAVTTPVPGNLAGLVVADFNLDGNLDIATSIDQDRVTLLLGNGNGTFQTPIAGQGSVPLAAGDLNEDGEPDLVSSNGGILLNNGDGTFTGGQSLSLVGQDVGATSQAAVLSDLNSDQKLDLVVSQSNTHLNGTTLTDIVTVVNGNGDGTFATFPAYAGIRGIPPGGFSYVTFGSLAAADFDGDGKIDLDVGVEFFLKPAVSNGIGAGLYLNNGAGFSAPATNQLTLGSRAAPYVVAEDLNGDGRMDLAVASSNGSGGAVAFLLGNGNGTFQPEQDYGAGMNGPIAIGDFNHDGKLDVLGVTGVQLSVLIGEGDGTFGFPVDSPTGSPGSVRGLAVADFDHDGKLDAAALIQDNGSWELAIFTGNGDGTFSIGPTYNAGANLAAIATGDLNGDGIPDLVVANSDIGGQDASIVVLLGVGDGSFQSPMTTVTGNQISAVAVSDLNLDGKADVVISNIGWGDVSVLLGKGDGTLQAPMQFYLNNFMVGAVTVADFNGDGKPDLAVAGFNSISVVLSGSGLGGPAGLLSPPALGFGNQTVGFPSTAQTAVLSNSGSKTLNISSIAISGPQGGDYQQTNTCGASLAPAESCLISIVFSPQAAGTRTAVVQVIDNAANSPQMIILSGAGGLFTVSVAPASLTFANQLTGSTSASQAVTLTNTGNELLVINNISVTGTDPGDFLQTNNCGSPIGNNPLALAVGDSCLVNVSFAPTAGGSRAATLSFTNNASNSPQTVALSGTAQDFAVTVASPSQTVSPGQTATYNLAVSPGGGFNQMVEMSCTGAPTTSTCTLSPSSFTLNGSTSQPVAVTVATTGTMAGLPQPPFGRPSGDAYAMRISWFGLGLVCFLSLATCRRDWHRPWFRGLSSVCLLGIGMTFSACGGPSGGGGGGGGTQPGTYNLTVTGKFTSGSTTLTRTTQLTLIVQ
jgi:hypothetical protein